MRWMEVRLETWYRKLVPVFEHCLILAHDPATFISTAFSLLQALDPAELLASASATHRSVRISLISSMWPHLKVRVWERGGGSRGECA